MATYSEGQRVRLQCTFKNDSGAPADPDAIFFMVRKPNKPRITLQFGVNDEVKKNAIGVYYVEIDTTNKSGHWRYRWFSTGVGQASNNGSFYVMRAVI